MKSCNLSYFNDFVHRETGYKVLGSFLFGSQNYGLDTEKSDVDIITIVIPSLEYIITHKDFIIKKYDKMDGGKVLVYDIRRFIELILKMDSNSLECFYTPYCKIVDDECGKTFNLFIKHSFLRSNLIFYKPQLFASATLGRAKNYLLQAEKARLRDNKEIFCKKIAMGQYYLDVLDKYYSNDFVNYYDLIQGKSDILDIKNQYLYFNIPFDYYKWEKKYKQQISISEFETDVPYNETPDVKNIMLYYIEQLFKSYFSIN